MSRVHNGRFREEYGKKPEVQSTPKVKPTVEQLRLAQLLSGTGKKCSSQHIDQVIEIIGCSQEVAEAMLENCNNDPVEAIDRLINSPEEKDEWQEASTRRPRKTAQPVTTSSNLEASDVRKDRSKSLQNGGDESEYSQPRPPRIGDMVRGRKSQAPRFRGGPRAGAPDRQYDKYNEEVGDGDSRSRGGKRNNQSGRVAERGRGRNGRRGGRERLNRGGRRSNADGSTFKSQPSENTDMSISMWTGAPEADEGSFRNIGKWTDTAPESNLANSETAPVPDDFDDEWSGDLLKGVEFTPSHVRGSVSRDRTGGSFEQSSAIHVNVEDILKSVSKNADVSSPPSSNNLENLFTRLETTDTYGPSTHSSANDNYVLAEGIKNAVGIGKVRVSESTSQNQPHDTQRAAENIKNVVGIGSHEKASVQPNIQPPRMKFQRSRLPPPSKIPASPVQMPRAYSAQTRDLQFGVDFGSDIVRPYTASVSQTPVSGEPVVSTAALSSEGVSYTTIESTGRSLVNTDTQSEALDNKREQVESRAALSTPTRSADISRGASLGSSFSEQQFTARSSSSQPFSQTFSSATSTELSESSQALLPTQQSSFGGVYSNSYKKNSSEALAQQQPAFQQGNFPATSSVAEGSSLYDSGSSGPLRQKRASPDPSSQQAPPQAQQSFTQFQNQAPSAYQPNNNAAREQFNSAQLAGDFGQLSVPAPEAGATTYEAHSATATPSTTPTQASVTAASSSPSQAATPSTQQYSTSSRPPPNLQTTAASASGQEIPSQLKLPAGMPSNLPPMFSSPLMPGHSLPVMPMVPVPAEYDMHMRMLMSRDPTLGNVVTPSAAEVSAKLNRGDSVQSPPQQPTAASAVSLNSHHPSSSAAALSQQQAAHQYMQVPLNPAAAAMYYNSLFSGVLPFYGIQAMTQASHSASTLPGLQRNTNFGAQSYDYDQQSGSMKDFKYGPGNSQNSQHLPSSAGSAASEFNSAYGKAHHGYDKQPSGGSGAGVSFHTTQPPFNYLQGMGSGSGQGGFPYLPMMAPPAAAPAQQNLMHPHMQQDGSSGARMNPQSSGSGQAKPKSFSYWS